MGEPEERLDPGELAFEETWASLVAQMAKNLPAMQETQVQSLGRENPLKEGNGSPVQYSCLENFTDRGTRWATVHGVAKSQTRLSDFYGERKSSQTRNTAGTTSAYS